MHNSLLSQGEFLAGDSTQDGDLLTRKILTKIRQCRLKDLRNKSCLLFHQMEGSVSF